MEHDRAFLEAIQEHPDDDLHRLARADWLEEHGQDDYATFIRHQLRLAKLDEGDPARDALEDEADDLLARHEGEWAGRVGALALDWRWRRGMIEQVAVGADTLLEQGEELFAAMPIREVRLEAEPAHLPRLADCPLLGRVERLELGGPREDSPFASAYLRDGPLLALLRSRYLTRLTELELTNQGAETPTIQGLIEGGLLERLRVLELSGNKAIGDRALRLLAGASGRLERLTLANTNLTPHGLRNFLAAGGYPRLRSLDVNFGMLFRQGISPQAIERELLRSPLVQQLTSLWIYGVGLDEPSLGVLLRSPLAARLETLRLTSCGLGEVEAHALAGTENLAGLRRLELNTNFLRDKGCRALASSPYLRGLTELDLSNNDVGGPGLRALLAAPGLAGLLRLDLSSNHIGASGAAAIASGPRRLTWLRLGVANLREEGARALVGSNSLSRLRVLWLNGNNLGDGGVPALAASPHLPHLRELHLDGNVDSPGAQALIESPHLARVRQLSMRGAYITSNEREQLFIRYGPGTQF
jgi:uncharacterized protein (TIGR02996 family)